MKLLLVGPAPPPHGGISVHLETARRLLRTAGIACDVIDPSKLGPATRGGRWLRAARLARTLRSRAHGGWTVHVHINGHNATSWQLAVFCGGAAAAAPARLLTLHSGMVPRYLASASSLSRAVARRALASFDRVICVNPAVRDAAHALGADPERLEVTPAYLPEEPATVRLPDAWRRWLATSHPVVMATLCFRPEYGLDLLLAALERLRAEMPRLGGLLVGGERGAAPPRALTADWLLLAGDVPHAVCLALMRRADLFVRPTLADGDALSVREALALRLPVVATDTGSRPRGVHLVRPGDEDGLVTAIRRALAETHVRRAVARPRSASCSLAREGLLATYRRAACGA